MADKINTYAFTATVNAEAFVKFSGLLNSEQQEYRPDRLIVKCSEPEKLTLKVADPVTGEYVSVGALTEFSQTIPTKFIITPNGLFIGRLDGEDAIIMPGTQEEWEAFYTPDRTMADFLEWAHGDELPAKQQNPLFMQLVNSAPYHQTRDIISRGDFTKNNGEKWPTGYIKGRNLRADVQVRPDPAQEQYLTDDELANWQIRAAQTAVEMDDKTADVLDYITWEVVKQAKNGDQDIRFSADRFCELRGMKKQKSSSGRRGGYKTEYRREFASEVEKLGSVWIRISEMDIIETDDKGKRRRSKTRFMESRAIVVSARTGQLNFSGRAEPDAYLGRLGPLFAASVFGVWHQIALVSIKALSYDPYKQLPEKKLTRYLSWQWRIRQGSGNYSQPYEVSTLLEAVVMKTDSAHPERTKNRLEKALDTLESDGVISAWQYGEGWDESIIGNRGWAKQWETWRVVIEPPQEILDHYKAIPTAEANTQKAIPANSHKLGERLQAARKGKDFTQLQAAEDIGVNQATLSRVERGKNTTAANDKKIEAWLTKMNSQDAVN